MHARHATPPTRTRRLLRWCGACMLVVACAGDGTYTFAGNGPTLTRSFTVEPNWQMQWEFAGQLLRITVLDEYGERAGTAHQQGPGTGSARFPSGGVHSLEIQTEDMSTWTIRIAQAP